MKKTIHRLQELPLGTRKIVLWIIVVLIAIAFLFWRINVFRSRIGNFERNEPGISSVFEGESFDSAMQGIGEIKELLKETKELKDLFMSGLEDTHPTKEDLVYLYIIQNSSNVEEDLKRAREDEDFFQSILYKIKEN